VPQSFVNRRASLVNHNTTAVARAASVTLESLESRRLLASTATFAEAALVSTDETVKASLIRTADLEMYTQAELNSAAEWLIGARSPARAEAIAQAIGAKSIEPAPFVNNSYIITVDPGVQSQMLLRESGAMFMAPMLKRQHTPRLIPNDTNFPNQWHLRNTGQGGGTANADANVTSVWDQYTGAGVVVSSVDDGITTTHQDLAPNYLPAFSYDFNSNEPDPSPGSHGTSVAGVMAAKGNNGVGVAGAAFNAGLSGIRLIAAAVSDATEANALTFANNDIDIYNNSWGPNDGGTTLSGPGPLTLAAFANAVQNGRNGLGSIYTWAGGNGGNGDNVNYDGYANSRYTIAVGAITNTGVRSSYSERGAPVLVSAYSNGGSLGISTTSSSGYTSTFGGTSSAAPLAAGVIALILEANPNLTWRDVQHVLVNSARKTDPTGAGWEINGAGHDFNDRYGFGAVDAAPAVALAEAWTNVAPEVSALSGISNVAAAIPDGNTTGVSRSIVVSDPVKIETVEVVLNASHLSRGQLRLVLTSPSGTQSILAEPRADTGDNYSNWSFTSKHFWDEEAAGTWTLTVTDTVSGTSGTWNNWALNIYGTQQGQGIYGTAFEDSNGSGNRDGGEPGLGGITVFLDSNNNGIFDSGEETSITTATGNYAFNDMPDGSYAVRAVAPSGLRPTGASVYNFTLNSSTPIATGANFGFVNPKITGTVFTDVDDDGVFDAGEVGRSGVTVYLDANNNSTLDGGEASVVTDAQGAYALTGLADGNYNVRIVAPAATRQTAPATAHNVNIAPASLASLNNHFGVTSAVRIAGAVYNDANGNGTQDGGENGIGGARVYLDTNNNGLFDNQNHDFAQNTALPLPDDRTTRFSNLVIAGTAATVNNIGVRLNITHTFMGDLDIFLISPQGTRVELTTDNGSSTDGANVTLLDSAANSVTSWPTASGVGPVTGTWRPEGSLASLNGEPLDGTWQLEITDDAGGDSGTLNSWSLFQISIEPNRVTPADGSYSFTPLEAGSYVLRQEPLGGGFSFTNPATGGYNVAAAAAEVLSRDFGNANITTVQSDTGLYVRLNGAGDMIEIFRNTTGAGAADLTLPVSTASLNLIGSAANDGLFVDLVNGNPIPTGGINFSGLAGTDSATLVGGDNADAATFENSSIVIGGRTINYGDAENVSFHGNGGPDSLTYLGSSAAPSFIGGSGVNTLTVSAGVWFYGVDANTQNSSLNLIINGTGSVAATASQHLASLAMSGNGQFSLTADDRLIRTGAFSSSGAASLDLRDGSLIVDYAGASPLAAVQAALTSGHASGAWNGSGIRSSTANASAIADAIGYAEASAIMTTPGTFAGETVDATTVVARYTLAGDANLNGTVNLDDFTSLAVGFGVASIWSSGDFTYDGAVNLGDFTALAANFGNTAPAGLPRTAGLPSTTTIAAVSPFGDKRIGEEILLIGAPGI